MKLLFLLRKDLLIHRRRIGWVLCELLLPIILPLSGVIQKHLAVHSQIESTVYSDFPVSGSSVDFKLKIDNQTISTLLFRPKTVAYTPDTFVTKSVIGQVKDRFHGELYFKAFVNEQLMVKHLSTEFDNHPYGSIYLGGIVFDEKFSKGIHVKRIKYKIRLSNTARNPGHERDEMTKMFDKINIDRGWNTKLTSPNFQYVGPRQRMHTDGGKPGYWREGFLSLQRAVDIAITEYLVPQSTRMLGSDDFEVNLCRFPYPSFTDNPMLHNIQFILPLAIMGSFLISVIYIIDHVTCEKEMRLNDYMHCMGLGRGIQWLAHFLSTFAQMSIIVLMIILIFTVKIAGIKGNEQTDPTLLFVFLLIYGLATICYCFTVTAFFKTANRAAICGGVLFFLIYMPFWTIQPRYDDLSFWQKILASLDFNVAMGFGTLLIINYEGKGIPFQWKQLFTTISADDNFVMGHVFAMLIVDSFIFVLITWYVERVFPGDQGVPEKFWFPFMPSYWCRGCPQMGTYPKELLIPVEVNYSSNTEPDPVGIKPSIWTHQLSKIFKSGVKTVVAVDNLTIKLYPRLIGVLLGENGAGKSTTISILSGLQPPSFGKTVINEDLTSAISEVRHLFGICPEYNVFYDNLTVFEHLKLFCRVKGKPWKDDEANEIVEMLGLSDKLHVLAHTLSGGMKRKLNLAIALIGSPQIIILDEPTSGMDPISRHQAWMLIQKAKPSKTILITTHDPEEADILADRITILAKGKLQCSGSSSFLKEKSGSGYHLRVLFSKTTINVTTELQAVKLLQVVNKHCYEGVLETSSGTEATYFLPVHEKIKFAPLLADLEVNQEKFSLRSFGISTTSIKEVFLRLTHKMTQEGTNESSLPIDADEAEKLSLDEIYELKKAPRLNGFCLKLHQIKALLIKQLLYFIRNWMLLIVQVLSPALIVIYAIIINKLLPGPDPSPPSLNLNLNNFKSPIISTRKQMNGTTADEIAQIYDNMVADSGMGLRNVLPETSMTDFYLNLYNSMGLNIVNTRYIVGADFLQAGPVFNFTAYFNNQPYHGPGIALNMIDNAILRYLLKNDTSIETFNHPLPSKNINSTSDWLAAGTAEFNVAVNILVGITLLTSPFIILIVHETDSKFKHMQLLSGVHPMIFWVSTFLWDFIIYMMSVLLIIIVMALFHLDELVGNNSWTVFLLLLLLYGWSILPTIYATSIFCNTGTKGLIISLVYQNITGLTTIATTMCLYVNGLKKIYNISDWIFRTLFPSYCLVKGTNVFYTNQFIRKTCLPVIYLCGKTDLQNDDLDYCCTDDSYTDYSMQWRAPGIGRELFCLTCQGILFWIILYLNEMQIGLKFTIFFQKLSNRFPIKRWQYEELDDTPEQIKGKSMDTDDDDVICERLSISGMSITDAMLIARNLTKRYGNFKAVDGIDFCVRQGECFGLLGENGSGKTTTFQMLTGQTDISKGNGFVCGLTVASEWTKIGQHVGYCPQFDAVIDQLTGYETLALFARLRGVSESQVKLAVQTIAQTVGIKQQLNRTVRCYSKGNLRRLSLGMALVGLPDLLLLDEPTTGVDPVAQRTIWNLLVRLRNRGIAIMLSSHSMEECESLCTKLAVIDGGKLKCFGSLQHIKNKYGTMYNLQFKIRQQKNVEHAMHVIKETFHGSILKELGLVQLTYEIPGNRSITLSTLFSMVEGLVDSLEIVHYSLSLTSLEQVFLATSKKAIIIEKK